MPNNLCPSPSKKLLQQSINTEDIQFAGNRGVPIRRLNYEDITAQMREPVVIYSKIRDCNHPITGKTHPKDHRGVGRQDGKRKRAIVLVRSKPTQIFCQGCCTIIITTATITITPRPFTVSPRASAPFTPSPFITKARFSIHGLIFTPSRRTSLPQLQ